MTSPYKQYFGFKRDPFSADIDTKDLLKLPTMLGVKERMDYTIDLGGVMVVTGEVGCGKSTSLRFSQSHYHPAEVCTVSIIANSGGITEVYKSICWELGLEPQTTSRARLINSVKTAIAETVKSKKQKIVLIIDEANLLRNEIFYEIHTLSQYEHDSKNLVTTILCGQTSLIDKLNLRGAAPLASRVISKTHLGTLEQAQVETYVDHHLKIAGIKKPIFEQSALTAIYQGSGGILRKINSLARGGLIAATIEQRNTVTAEHIRIAASELI